MTPTAWIDLGQTVTLLLVAVTAMSLRFEMNTMKTRVEKIERRLAAVESNTPNTNPEGARP